MNYKMNVEEWRDIIENASESTETICDHPYLVLDVNCEFDDCYGQGPFNMVFAYKDAKTKKWMSYEYPGEEISYHDFRDANAHNVGGHSGKVSHTIDAYELSCILLDLLTENETLKEKLRRYEKPKDDE